MNGAPIRNAAAMIIAIPNTIVPTQRMIATTRIVRRRTVAETDSQAHRAKAISIRKKASVNGIPEEPATMTTEGSTCPVGATGDVVRAVTIGLIVRVEWETNRTCMAVEEMVAALVAIGGTRLVMRSLHGSATMRPKEGEIWMSAVKASTADAAHAITRSDDRIKEDINDRLTDHSYLDASDIEVEVSGGDVVLTGTVENRWSKRKAEDLAEGCSGVKNVENRLRVKRNVSDSKPQYDNLSRSTSA